MNINTDIMFYSTAMVFSVLALFGVQPVLAGAFALYFLQSPVMSGLLSDFRWGWYVYFGALDVVVASLILWLLPASGAPF